MIRTVDTVDLYRRAKFADEEPNRKPTFPCKPEEIIAALNILHETQIEVKILRSLLTGMVTANVRDQLIDLSKGAF